LHIEAWRIVDNWHRIHILSLYFDSNQIRAYTFGFGAASGLKSSPVYNSAPTYFAVTQGHVLGKLLNQNVLKMRNFVKKIVKISKF